MRWFGRGGETQPAMTEGGEKVIPAGVAVAELTDAETPESPDQTVKNAPISRGVERVNSIGFSAKLLTDAQLWMIRDVYNRFKKFGRGGKVEDLERIARELQIEHENKLKDTELGTDQVAESRLDHVAETRVKEANDELVGRVLSRLKKGEPLDARDYDVLVNDLVDADLDSALARMSLSANGFKNVQHMLNTLGVESVHHEDVVAVRQDESERTGLQAKIDKLPAFWQRQARSALRSGVVSIGVGTILITMFGLPLLPVLGGAAASYVGANIGRTIGDAAYRERKLQGAKEGEDNLAYKVAQDKIANIVTMREYGKKYKETANVDERAELAKQIIDRMKFNESQNLKQYKSISKKARLIEIGAGIVGGGMIGGILAQAWHSLAVTHEVARETKEQTAQKLAEWAEKGVRVEDGHLVVDSHLNHLGHVLKKTADHDWHFIIEQKDITSAMDRLGEHWQHFLHGAGQHGPFVSTPATEVPVDLPGGDLFHISEYSPEVVNRLAAEQVTAELAQHAENVLTPLIAGAATTAGIALEHAARPEFGADGQPLGHMTKEDRHAMHALSATVGAMKRQADYATTRGASNGGGGGGAISSGGGGGGSDGGATVISPDVHVVAPDTAVVAGGVDVIYPDTTVIRAPSSVVDLASDTGIVGGDDTGAEGDGKPAVPAHPTEPTEPVSTEQKDEKLHPQLANEVSRSDDAVRFNVAHLERGATIVLKIDRYMQMPGDDGSGEPWSYENMPRLIINGGIMGRTVGHDTSAHKLNKVRALQVSDAFTNDPALYEQFIAIQVFPHEGKIHGLDDPIWEYNILSDVETSRLEAELRVVAPEISHDENSTTMGDREKYAQNDTRNWRKRFDSSNQQKQADKWQFERFERFDNEPENNIERDAIEKANRTTRERPIIEVHQDLHPGDVILVPLDEVTIKMQLLKADKKSKKSKKGKGSVSANVLKRMYSFQRFDLKIPSGEKVPAKCEEDIEKSDEAQLVLSNAFNNHELKHFDIEIDSFDYDDHLRIKSCHITPVFSESADNNIDNAVPNAPVPSASAEPAIPSIKAGSSVADEHAENAVFEPTPEEEDHIKTVHQFLDEACDIGEEWLTQFDNPEDKNFRLVIEGSANELDNMNVYLRWTVGQLVRSLVEKDLDTNVPQVRQAIVNAIHRFDFESLNNITITVKNSDYTTFEKNYNQFEQSIKATADEVVTQYIKDGPTRPTLKFNSIELPDDAEKPVDEEGQERAKIRDIRYALAKYQNIGREWLGELDADEAENPRFNMYGLADNEHQREIQYRLMVGGMLFEAIKKKIDPNKVPVVITSLASKVDQFKQFNLLKRIFRTSSEFGTVDNDYKKLQKWVKKTADGIIKFNTETTPSEPAPILEEPIPAVEPSETPATGEVETPSESPTPEIETKSDTNEMITTYWEHADKIENIDGYPRDIQLLLLMYYDKYKKLSLPSNGQLSEMQEKAEIALDTSCGEDERWNALLRIQELERLAHDQAGENAGDEINAEDIVTPEAGVTQPSAVGTSTTEANETPKRKKEVIIRENIDLSGEN